MSLFTKTEQAEIDLINIWLYIAESREQRAARRQRIPCSIG